MGGKRVTFSIPPSYYGVHQKSTKHYQCMLLQLNNYFRQILVILYCDSNNNCYTYRDPQTTTVPKMYMIYIKLITYEINIILLVFLSIQIIMHI